MKTGTFLSGFLLFTTLVASADQIVVTTPDGAEVGTTAWVVGTPYDITWTSSGTVSDNIVIELFDSTNLFATLGTGLTNNGVFNTVVSEQEGQNYRIRIRDGDDATIEDFSDSPFWLVEQLHMTAPDGGEFWYAGLTNMVTWDSPKWGVNNLEGIVEIWFSNDGGTNWFVVANPTNISGNNVLAWMTPSNQINLISKNAKMGVATPGAIDPITAFFGDISDNTFVLAGIGITYPNSSSAIARGSTINVEWISAGAGTGGVSINFYDGVSWTNLVTNAPSLPGTNSYPITLNAPDPTEAALIHIVANDDFAVAGMSEEYILADIQITAPVAGPPAVRDQWQIGQTNQVEWVSDGAGGLVDIEYSVDGSNWFPIAMGYTNTNSSGGVVITNYSPPWVVQGPASSNAMIRVTSVATPILFSTTEPFDISGLQVDFPNGGEFWEFTSTNEARWLQQAAGAFLHLDIAYVSSPTSNDWERLVSNATIFNERWDIAPSLLRRPSTAARVRITAVSPPSGIPMVDISDFMFTIRGLSIFEPAIGSVYTLETIATNGLRWYSAAAASPIATFLYSSDGGQNYDDVITFSGIPFVGNVDADPSLNKSNWEVSRTFMPSTNARVKVVVASYESVSEPFTLRGIRIDQPTAGQVFNIGGTESTLWSEAGFASDAMINMYLSTDGGTGFGTNTINVIPVAATNGTYGWSIPIFTFPTLGAVLKMEIVTSSLPQDIGMTFYSEPFTLSPDNTDADNDGMSDWEEYIAGTDPTNSTSIFKITDISTATTNNLITWDTIAGKNYTVQTTTNLMSSWSDVSDPMYTNIMGSGAPLSYTNTDSEDRLRYFRVKVR